MRFAKVWGVDIRIEDLEKSKTETQLILQFIGKLNMDLKANEIDCHVLEENIF